MTGAEKDSLHELSYELGRNSKGLEDLNKLFEQHCKDDDRRHEENVALLKATNEAIAAQSKALEKLMARVALTNPGGSMLSRKQIAALALIGTGVMVVVGWIIEAAVKWAAAWVLSSILKVKLGA
jgi:ferric-dicitrate binding protein FerR (iron transport regulator)